MSTECPFSDKCKGAALCPSSDDACPSVTEIGIEQLTTERDQARHELAEAVGAVKRLLVIAERALWLTEVVVEKVDSKDYYKLDTVAMLMGSNIRWNIKRSDARAIVAKYMGAETVVPACCLGCLHDHTGAVGCGVFQRRPVGEICGTRTEAENKGE